LPAAGHGLSLLDEQIAAPSNAARARERQPDGN
jgi:hypothetical protein